MQPDETTDEREPPPRRSLEELEAIPGEQMTEADMLEWRERVRERQREQPDQPKP